MNETIQLQVDASGAGERIDKFIAQHAPDCSRSRVQALLAEGAVLLNQNPCLKVSEKVKEGDLIEITPPPPEPSQLEPDPMPLEILYEDDDLAVVNKPWGVSVHPAGSWKGPTLVNALLHHIKNLSGVGGVARPGIVHRLDRVTSGVLIVAKHDVSHRRLSARFKDRKMQKIYWAIVHGRPPGETGEIDQPIGRHETDRKRMTIRPDGRPSVTRYRVMKEGLGGSWVEVYPVTGRTHQIRVHFKHLGTPVAGDPVYSTRKFEGRGELERIFAELPGIALHARSLRFSHPMTGREMYIEAEPAAPFLDVLRRMT